MARKADLYAHCLAHTQRTLAALTTRLESITEARNSDTKSSAGDKYETGRAMMQREADTVERQLAESRAVLATLQQLDPRQSHEIARAGSLVHTDKGPYYLAIGLGKVVLDGKRYYVVSLGSPIGKGLLGKRAGEHFAFGGRTFGVVRVE